MRLSNLRKASGLMILGACCLVLAVSGCSEKGGGQRSVNLSPDTFISFGPKEQSRTYFKVDAYWYGTDEDGDVDHYEIALAKGFGRDYLDTTDFNDFVADLAWVATRSTESTFVLPTDSCCYADGKVRYGLGLWGILVRSVDNEGVADSTPASVFFMASNIIPKVNIIAPKRTTGMPITIASRGYAAWRGSDADGDVSRMEFKYLVIPQDSVGKTYPTLPPLTKEAHGLGHASPPPMFWSEWVPADCTYVSDLNLKPYSGTGKTIRVYVVARDEGGAILEERLFSGYNSDANWSRALVSLVSSGVPIIVDAGSLGMRRSLSALDNEEPVRMFVGTTIRFRFYPSLEDRGKGQLAEAYRYYYDDREDPRTSTWAFWTGVEPIRDRSQTPEWSVRYPGDGSYFEPSIGQHRFVVAVRDISKQETSCMFKLDVLDGPRGKNRRILVVDDNKDIWKPTYEPFRELKEDSLWANILEGYEVDWFDTGRYPNHNKVDVRLMSNATTTIWLADRDWTAETETFLFRVATRLGNYIRNYTLVGGNIIIVGADPLYAHMYYPDPGKLWPGGPPLPQNRADFSSADLRPRYDAIEGDSVYNWNWEILGIERIERPSAVTTKYTTLVPCDAGFDSIHARPRFPDTTPLKWDGYMFDPIVITSVRKDIDVRPLFSFIPLDEELNVMGEPSCQSRLIGLWAPANENRGHAAYIGIPPWYFDNAAVAAAIDTLLVRFGEVRMQP